MENRLINWQNGMLLSASNLMKTEDYFLEKIAVTCRLLKGAYEWGLASEAESNSLLSVYESSNGKLFISVSSSLHISVGGLLLEIPKDETLDMVTEQLRGEDVKSRYAVVIQGFPDERVQYGEIDADENPPRMPYSRMRLNISLLPFDNIASIGENSTVVGVIKRSASVWSVDSNYILPLIRLKNLRDLTDRVDKIFYSYDRIVKLAVQVLDKIQMRGRGYPLADNIFDLFYTVLSYLEGGRFRFFSERDSCSPYKFRLFFANLSGNIVALMKQISVEERRELLDYINEWCLIPPGIFLQMLDSVAEPDFKQWNISESIFKIEDMIRTLIVIFEKFNQLEFIGQHKENIVIS